MLKTLILIGCLLRLILDGGNGQAIVLAHQTAFGIEAVDSLFADEKGNYCFEWDSIPKGGQYCFVQENRRLFNFLLSSPIPDSLSFTAWIRDGRTVDIRCSGSEENTEYISLMQFLQDGNFRLRDMGTLLDRARDQSPSQQEELKRTLMKQVQQIEQESRRRCLQTAKDFENTTLSLIAQNVFTPAPPDSIQASGPEAKKWTREHYLDYLDFDSPYLMGTSILPARLQEYFRDIVPQHRDSIGLAACRIIDRCTNPEVKDFCARWCLASFLNSDIMGMDTAVCLIADKYYLSGLLRWTGSEEELSELKLFADFNRNCLLGQKAPNLQLKDINGEIIDLHSIDSPFTLVFFYEASCPVCAEEILQLRRFFETYTGDRIQVYAVYTQASEEVWKKYISFFPSSWQNVWDPDFSSGFQKKYNVRSTPKLYLLDKDKIIVGKNIHTENLNQLINQLCQE